MSATKNGWASIRAMEVTIEPGDGLDMGKAIAATIAALGWAPPEAEFNLTENVGVNGPTDPPPVAEDARPSRPSVAKAGPRDE